MEVSKEAILSKTHYGLNIYSHILREYYPGETVLFLSGRDCNPARNPFDGNKPSLFISVADNCAMHRDASGSIPDGNVFTFAAHYFGLQDKELYNKLDEVLYLRIAKPHRLSKMPVPHVDPFAQDEPLSGLVCSFFKGPVLNVLPEASVSLLQIYELVRSTEYQLATNKLRSITDRSEARKYKARNFDYVTFSGTFHKRNDAALIQHSGLVVIDFDHIQEIEDLKRRLLKDEYFETQLLFTSPSGDGLKWVIPIDLSLASHASTFTAIVAYIKSTYGLDVDDSGKDISRACFLPHDPTIYIHPKYKL